MSSSWLLALGLVVFIAGCGDPPAARANVLHLHADGAVQLSWKRDVTFDLAAPDPIQQEKALGGVSAALKELAAKPELLDAFGASSFVLKIEGASEARWLHMQWLMQVAAGPALRIWQIEVRLEGESSWTPLELPRDSLLSSWGPTLGDVDLSEVYSKVKLKLFRKEAGTPGAYTKMRIDNSHTFNLKDGEIDKWLASARSVIKEKFESFETDVVEVVALPPTGGEVPFADVLRIYRMVRSLGHETFLFEGALPPIRQGRRGN